MQLSEHIRALFPDNLDILQISDEASTIIVKVYQGKELTEHEMDTLLNPTETAAALSVKYRRPVNHRYVKEITRAVTNKKTGHTTPARLTHDRVAGRTYLYKTKNVLKVNLRQSTKIAS